MLLRLLSLALFLVGLALIVMLVAPGPSSVADVMGQSCSHDGGRSSETCTVGDVALLSLGAGPLLMLVGAVFMLVLRPASRGPITLDFSRRG